MKNKKQANAKEEVDFSTLPKATTLISSLMFDVKNPDTKLKLFEKFYKSYNGDPIHLITREHIIEYAKSAGIYVDPSEGKKPNPKDPTPIEKVEITPKELATACLKLINEKSVNIRKDKKVLFDKIQEAKAQREEAEKFYQAQQQQEIINQEKETKQKSKKKKPEPKDKKDKKTTMPKPEEIEIPKYDAYEIEMLVTLFNYPLNEEELTSLIAETNEFDDHLVINLFQLVVDNEEFVEVKQEVVLDKKGKPVAAKEAKVAPEVALMQKYIALPPYLIPPPEPLEQPAQPSADEKGKSKEPSKNDVAKEETKQEEGDEENKEEAKEEPIVIPTVSDVYKQFIGIKNNSDKLSNLRKGVFETEEFNLKEQEKNIDDYVNELFKNFTEKMYKMYAQYVYYSDWSKTSETVKLSVEGEKTPEYTLPDCININKGIIYENDTVGRLLLSICQKLIENKRLDRRNIILYETNAYDNIFSDSIKGFNYEYDSNKISNTIDSLCVDVNNNSIGHTVFDLAKQHKEVFSQIEKSDIYSSPFKLIINFHDHIYQYCLEEKLGGKFINLLEKNFNIFLSLPALEKSLETFYSKENLHTLSYDLGKNNLIYPFILKRGITRETYDRYYVLSSFEKMIGEKVPEQKLNFNSRIYEEKLNKDLFKQVLNEITMYDYEVVSKMDERTKKTFIAFFYRFPKGRVYRKQRKNNYLSKPDFEAWVKMFSPKFKQVKISQSQQSDTGKKKDPKDKNVNVEKPNFKYEVDLDGDYNDGTDKPKELQPKQGQQFYEADDLKVGEMKERIKYMFPSDNGIMVKKEIVSGIFTSKVSYIRKDELIFGIKKTDENKNEFWLNFDNDLKLSAIYREDYDPLFKNNEDPIESPTGTIISLTTSDGILIEILPNGEICQKKFINEDCSANIINDSYSNFDNHLCLGSQLEHYRMVGLKGNVVKYYPLETKILYSNGNYCSIKNNLATNVNNRGYRIARSVTDETEVTENEGIPISTHYDPETNSHSTTRQDNVVLINYPDSGYLVIHEDDTKIYTTPTIKEITHIYIEHDLYPSTEIILDEIRKRTKTCLASGSTEALLGSDNIMSRSYDGRVCKISLPDDTIIKIYKEKKATEEFDTYSFNTVTLISRPNGTVIRISQEGDIAIVTSKEREILNREGANLNFTNFEDTDYLFEINGSPKERKGGVYSVDLKQGKIYTKDNETNIFELHANGDAKCKIQGTTIREMNEKTIDEMSPESPRYNTPEYINPETRFSAPPNNFYPPRLFVVDNDLTATELLCEEQLRDYKLVMQMNKQCEYTRRIMEKGNWAEHFWIKKKVPVSELLEKTRVINSLIRIPQKFSKFNQTEIHPTYPQKEVFIVRKILENKGVNDEERERIHEGEKELEEFLTSTYTKKEKEKVDKKIINMNKEIQRRILRERNRSKNIE